MYYFKKYKYKEVCFPKVTTQRVLQRNHISNGFIIFDIKNNAFKH